MSYASISAKPLGLYNTECQMKAWFEVGGIGKSNLQKTDLELLRAMSTRELAATTQSLSWSMLNNDMPRSEIYSWLWGAQTW